LGLRYVTVSEGLREKMKLSVSQGALIIGQMPHAEAIVPGSPAAKAGIREKDIIRAVNGTELTAEHTIQDFLEAAEVGDVLKLTVLRGRREFETKVTLAERR
jgi:S1-C subfamily serine protease